MRVFRRFAVAVLSACLAASLFGCGGSSSSSRESSSCAVEVGDVIDLGSVTFDSYSGGTYSGNPEWLVIGVRGDEALVITKGCIDLRPYDEDSDDWGASDIRQFLNGEFYDGLEDGTKRLVQAKSINDTETVDQVFLLAPGDVATAFKESSYQAEYVGYEGDDNGTYAIWKELDDLLSDVPWWLRVPNSEENTDFHAYSAGIFCRPSSEGSAPSRIRGIRPAMWVELPVGWDANDADDTETAGEAEGEPVDEEPASVADSTASEPAPIEAMPEPSLPDGVISWEDASDHVGEVVTVDGEVMGASYASGSNGGPTFVDLGADYPDPDRVSVVVWGEDRHRFSGAPESIYLGEHLRVTGEIYLYNGACNIKVTSPSQIEVL